MKGHRHTHEENEIKNGVVSFDGDVTTMMMTTHGVDVKKTHSVFRLKV